MVDCLTRDLGAAGSSLTGVTALCPWTRHVNPSLVLVQPRKTHPYINERLLIGPKEPNQTNKLTFNPYKPNIPLLSIDVLRVVDGIFILIKYSGSALFAYVSQILGLYGIRVTLNGYSKTDRNSFTEDCMKFQLLMKLKMLRNTEISFFQTLRCFIHHAYICWNANNCFGALRPKSTAKVMARRSVHLAILFPEQLTSTSCTYFRL